MTVTDPGQSTQKPKIIRFDPNLIRIWLSLALLEGITALILFLRIPGNSESAFLGGISRTRIGILGGFVLTLCILVFVTFLVLRNKTWAERGLQRIRNFLGPKYIYGITIGILFTGVFFLSQLLYLSGVVIDPYIKGYLIRLRPFIFWSLALFFQSLVILPLFRYGLRNHAILSSSQIFRYSGMIYLVFLLVVLFIVTTGIGIIPDVVGWDAPGTPLTFIQVGLAGLAGLLFFAIETRFARWKDRDGFRFDLLVGLFLWSSAFLIWTLEPLTPDYFAPAPRAPNYEIYPYSDAALHDVNAQELLIGEGFPGISRKPLYVLFLTLLHAVGGQSYNSVITLQVGVLALIPVAIYWLTKDLHMRLSGIIAAGLMILRERNAISLSGEIRVSHSKLLMSDMPAVLAIMILTWLVVRWLKNPGERKILPLWIGGALGLLMLLRPQFSLLIPIVLLVTILSFLHKPLSGFIYCGLIGIGILLTLSPWMLRSYNISGKLTLNDPIQMAFLTEQYHLHPQTESLELNPGESVSEFNTRINSYLRDFILKNPSYVGKFIFSHFLHNQIEMIQILPLSPWIVSNPGSDLFPYWHQNTEKLWRECCSVQAYVFTHKFWDPWLKSIEVNILVPILINLGIISLGIAVAHHKNQLLAWLPLLICLAYSFSTAIGRYSGWRLVLPADWVVLLYFSMGLGQVLFWLHRYYFRNQEYLIENGIESISNRPGRHSQPQLQFPWRKSFVLSLVLIGFGIVPLVVEATIPKRYQATFTPYSLSSEFHSFTEQEIQAFLSNSSAVIANGRALYPKHYPARQGEPGESWEAFLVRDYPRLGFFMVGSFKGNVILPMESPPESFPHASDVIVLGCQQESFLDAAAVKIWSVDGQQSWTIFRDSLSVLTCPLTPP